MTTLALPPSRILGIDPGLRVTGFGVIERSGNALAEAMVRIASEQRDRDAIRRYAERFGWDETVRGQLELCRAVVRPALGAAAELAS